MTRSLWLFALFCFVSPVPGFAQQGSGSPPNGQARDLTLDVVVTDKAGNQRADCSNKTLLFSTINNRGGLALSGP